jgi:hypothetical protein
MSVRMLAPTPMGIAAIHQTSKPHELAREINRLTDGIERDSKLAGEHLATLKIGKPPGITWEHYLKDCGVKISARHADRLIEAFQGPSRKPPIKPKPVSDIVSEPVVDPVEETDDSPLLFAAWQRSSKPARRWFVQVNRQQIEPLLEVCINARLKAKVEDLEGQVKDLSAENDKLRHQLARIKSPGLCKWVEDDGGRRAAGYGKPESDCVARAITIATDKPYSEVFEALKAGATDYVRRWPRSETAGFIKKSRSGGDPARGCYDAISARYLRSIGWQYTRTKGRLFLRADQLPRGRLIVAVNRHYVAVIDGVIHDTFNSGGAGKRPVKGYWTKGAEKAEHAGIDAGQSADKPREVAKIEETEAPIGAVGTPTIEARAAGSVPPDITEGAAGAGSAGNDPAQSAEDMKAKLAALNETVIRSDFKIKTNSGAAAYLDPGDIPECLRRRA